MDGSGASRAADFESESSDLANSAASLPSRSSAPERWRPSAAETRSCRHSGIATMSGANLRSAQTIFGKANGVATATLAREERDSDSAFR